METILVDFVKQIGHGIGIGAGGAVVVVLLGWLLHKLFVSLVDRSTAAYLQKHKAELDEEAAERQRDFEEILEQKRQVFARDLEKERARATDAAAASERAFASEIEKSRAEAQRALEAFKSELTIGAEMRRQIASRRLAAIGDLYELAIQLGTALRDLLNEHGTKLDVTGPMEQFDRSFREQTLFLEKVFADELFHLVARMRMSIDLIRRGLGTPEHANAVAEFQTRLVTHVRDELARLANS